jgi:four helix bundle protein
VTEGKVRQNLESRGWSRDREEASVEHGLRDVKELTVWQVGIQVCKQVYRVTGSFPFDERFGLTAQMRRAAVSVPSNLAEGYGRGTRKDYRQFVCIARGSACELETQAIIAQELGLLDAEQGTSVLDEINRLLQLLSGLARSLDT